MTDELAEILLVRVMGWDVDEVSAERPYLQAFAYYKYDEYQQFSPGMRFVESLALWLQQFHTKDERAAAYDFVKRRLLYISLAEMQHLVSVVYPDLIRPEIIRQAAQDLGIPEYSISRITQSKEFRIRRRQALFLGLSDGAHTDVFRRSNRTELSHEQVYQTYELSGQRAEKMLQKLGAALKQITGADPDESAVRFKTLILLDDFCGTGLTYLREDGTEFDGKIAKVFEEANSKNGALARLVNLEDVAVYVIAYVSTQRALDHLKKLTEKLWHPRRKVPKVLTLHSLGSNAKLHSPLDRPILQLCANPNYYDAQALESSSTAVGGTDVRLGFGSCALPLTLSHNTPNNSVSLLWAYEDAQFRGLFPRVPRHLDLR